MKKVVAISDSDDQIAAALAAGAVAAGKVGDPLLKEIINGDVACDVVVANVSLLKELKPFARELRQLMPNLKRGGFHLFFALCAAWCGCIN